MDARLNPYSSARSAYESIFAERNKLLLGTQPVLRQSPPMRLRSISVTLALTVVPMSAATKPAEPAPMTTRLLSNRFGFLNFLNARRALK